MYSTGKNKIILIILSITVVISLLASLPITQASGYLCSFINSYDQTTGGTSSVSVSVNGTTVGYTPATYNYPTTYDPTYKIVVTAELTNYAGDYLRGFKFDGVLYLGTTVTFSFMDVFNKEIQPIYQYYDPAANNNYTIVGVNDETTGLNTGNVTVTAHYTSRANEIFTVNGSYLYQSSAVPQYFSYDLGACTREYWLQPSQTSGTFYITNSSSLTTYTINFMDFTGILQTSPYIAAQTYINGTLVTVEQRMVDAQHSFQMNLVTGKIYTIEILGTSNLTYGDLLMTSTTSIQLTLRGVSFPKETLLLYQYVHAYSVRDYLNPIGSITVSYEDVKNHTNSVEVIIMNVTSNTAVFDETFTGAGNQTFSYTYAYADNATNYEVYEIIDHQDYGILYYNQYLIGEYTKPDNPLSLDAFGTIPGIETAWFLPALLIVFVAACFSELTSEVAAILTTLVAIVLAAIGFIPISTATLVSALSFGILAAIVSVKRRFY